MTRAVDGEARVRRRLLAAAPRLAVLDPDDYLRLNPDLAASDPWDHFARHGAWERRACVTPERLTAGLARATALAPRPRPLDLADAWRRAAEVDAVIRVSRSPTPAAAALATRLAAVLDEVGAAARVVHGGADAPAGAAATVLVDAAALYDGARPEPDALPALAAALVVVDAAVGDPGFAAALPYALAARGALCTEASAYAALAAAGVDALWIGPARAATDDAAAPPDHPLVAGLSRAARAAPPHLPLAERPIDVAALEDATGARTGAWERMADGFADSGLAMVVRRPADSTAHLPHEAALRGFVYARAKLVLHLHADAPRPVRDLTAAEAADAGAALLTEPSPPHLRLRPGVHVFESSARRMPALAVALTTEPDAAARRDAVARRLRAELDRALDPERLGLELAQRLGPAPRGDRP